MKVNQAQVPAYYGHASIDEKGNISALNISAEGEPHLVIPLTPGYTLDWIIDEAAVFARKAFADGYSRAKQDVRDALGLT